MDWFAAAQPLIVGHRGASADAPENTLAAFALARKQGADGIELDVRLSADGQPVVFHDSRLERTTNGSGPLSQKSAAQLQALDAGNGQHVPTLDEVFSLLGADFLYNVELKSATWRDRGLETAVAAIIRAHGLFQQVLLSSFNPLALRRMRPHLPSTPRAIIRVPGWLQFSHHLALTQADHPHYSMVDATYIAWARRRGYRVHAWTVDEPAEARRLVGLGVHGIITNKPLLVKEALGKQVAGSG